MENKSVGHKVGLDECSCYSISFAIENFNFILEEGLSFEELQELYHQSNFFIGILE